MPPPQLRALMNMNTNMCDRDQQETDSQSSSSSPPSPVRAPVKKRRRRNRKPTYLVQKEEKETLLDEIETLRMQLEAMRNRRQAKLLRAMGSQLSDVFHQQQLGAARLAAMLADYSIRQLNPLFLPIHLPRDMEERKATLMACCEHKVNEARRFIAERFRLLDMSLPYQNTEFTETRDVIRALTAMDVHQFSGRATVRNVFEAVASFFSDLEFQFWDHLGHVTMREDADEVYSDTVTQRRLVSATDSGTLLESNLVVFRQYSMGDRNNPEPMFRGEHAVFAEQCVESDELYPYVPSERLRRDMTSSIVVARLPPSESDGDAEEPQVVVMRWFFLRNRAGSWRVPVEVRRDLHPTGQPGNLLMQAIHDHLKNNAKTCVQQD